MPKVERQCILSFCNADFQGKTAFLLQNSLINEKTAEPHFSSEKAILRFFDYQSLGRRLGVGVRRSA